MCIIKTRILFWLIIGLLITNGKALGCDKPQVRCLNESTFTLNVTMFDRLFDFGVVLNCPENHFCHEGTDTPCKPYPQTTTTITAITDTEETATVAPPKCLRPGYHRATEDNEYYECVRVFWWYVVKMKTCKSGFIYSSDNPPCEKYSNEF